MRVLIVGRYFPLPPVEVRGLEVPGPLASCRRGYRSGVGGR